MSTNAKPLATPTQTQAQRMHSMTGFGRAVATSGEWSILVEVKSVNHRGCDIRVRVPPGVGSLGVEEALRQRIAASVKRGALAMSVHLTQASGPDGTAAQTIAQEVASASDYFTALQAQAQALGVAPPSFDVVWAAVHTGTAARREQYGAGPHFAGVAGDAAVDALRQVILQTSDQALGELVAARQREGAAIARDLQALMAQLTHHLQQISALAPAAPTHAAAQFAARMRQLGAAELTPERIATEAAALAARMDIHEEIRRAEAHIQAFADLQFAPAAGRRLDFLAQELHREFSTMGAKSSDREIISAIVAAKAELDRIREQVQNVE